MQDRPTIGELIEAVAGFLDEDATRPGPGFDRFRRLVTINALGIVARELELEDDIVRAEVTDLHRLLRHDGSGLPRSPAELRAQAIQLNAELAHLIRTGHAPPGTFEHVREYTMAKLRVVKPGLVP